MSNSQVVCRIAGGGNGDLHLLGIQTRMQKAAQTVQVRLTVTLKLLKNLQSQLRLLVRCPVHVTARKMLGQKGLGNVSQLLLIKPL